MRLILGLSSLGEELKVEIGHKVGGDSSAETEDWGRYNNSGGRLNCVDDGTHRQGEDELGEKDHAKNWNK